MKECFSMSMSFAFYWYHMTEALSHKQRLCKDTLVMQTQNKCSCDVTTKVVLVVK